MTRSQFLGLLTLPFVGKLLPENTAPEWAKKFELVKTISIGNDGDILVSNGKETKWVKYEPLPNKYRQYPLTEDECFYYADSGGEFINVDPKELNFDLGSMEIKKPTF